MRIKLTMEVAANSRLSYNYQYEIYAAINKIIAEKNSDFATWLHDTGYANMGKNFKLFTFSRIFLNKGSYESKKDYMLLKGGVASLYISFLPFEAFKNFLTGLFANNTIEIATKEYRTVFNITDVQQLAEPDFVDEMSFRSLSPILVSKPTDKHAIYLSPDDEGFKDCFFKNLVNKHHTFTALNGLPKVEYNIEDFELIPLGKQNKKLITIKKGTAEETKLRAYIFPFKVKADKELLQTGFYAGFGEKNAMGFGCCEVVL